MQRPRGLGDEAGGVASAHVDEDAHAALRVLAGDLHGLIHELHLRDLAEREQAARLGAQRQALHRGEVVAPFLGEPDDDGRAAVAFDECAHFLACERGFHEAVEVVGVDVEFPQRVPVGLDFDHRVLADAVELRLGAAGDAHEHFAHFAREAFHLIVGVSENLADEVGFRARHDFIEAQLNRLRDEHVLPRHLVEQRLAHERAELLFRDAAAPLLARLQHDVGVAHVWVHRVGGDFGGADAREDFFHLRELASQHGLALLLQIERRSQPRAAAADELKGEVALVELRDELRAEPRKHEQRKSKQREHRQHHEPAEAQAELEERRVEALGERDEPVVALADVAAEQERAQHGHQRKREDERAAEREHHDHGHRLEHFPLDALEREDGHIDDRDDEHAEEHRIRHFLRRTQHFLRAFRSGEAAPERVLPLAEMAHDVFHHHHCAVDDEAEINRAEAHQVSAEPPLDHAGHGEKHRERDDERDDECRAPVAEQREEHDDDKQRALGEVRFDRANGAIHEVAAVVEWADDDAGRKFLLHFGELLPHGAGDEPRVFAREHDGRADERLLGVVRARAGAEVRADADGGDFAEQDGIHAARELQRQLRDFPGGRDAARGADDELLAADLHVAAAGVARVLLHDFRERIERQPRCRESRRIGLDDDLLFVAAAGVHLRDSRGAAQQRLHLVFLNLPQRHELLLARGRFSFRLRQVIERVVKNLAEARGHRRELGREAGRQFVEHALQPLGDELADTVNVHAVAEGHRDLRQPELRQRAQLHHVGQAGHFALDGEGDELLDLFRRERRHAGIDLHLRVRDVRHRVDGQPQRRPPADADEDQRGEQHGGALPHDGLDEAVQHRKMLDAAGAGFAAAQDLQLGEPERHHWRDDDLVAGVEPVCDLRVIVAHRADLHRRPHVELAVERIDEMAFRGLEQRRARDGRDRFARQCVEDGEHSRSRFERGRAFHRHLEIAEHLVRRFLHALHHASLARRSRCLGPQFHFHTGLHERGLLSREPAGCGLRRGRKGDALDAVRHDVQRHGERRRDLRFLYLRDLERDGLLHRISERESLVLLVLRAVLRRLSGVFSGRFLAGRERGGGEDEGE